MSEGVVLGCLPWPGRGIQDGRLCRSTRPANSLNTSSSTGGALSTGGSRGRGAPPVPGPVSQGVGVILRGQFKGGH